MHRDELEPCPSDPLAYFTAEDVPDWATDDLLVVNDADLTPTAKKCPIEARRMFRSGHRNLGTPTYLCNGKTYEDSTVPSKQDCVCQTHEVPDACKTTTSIKNSESEYAIPPDRVWCSRGSWP